VKAQNISVFNTEHLSAMFERVIIATGSSNRQTKSLAASVRDSVKSSGFPVLSTEGEDNGEWIIVDCGAAVAHIMQPGIRDYYHLEEIWGGKNVRVKMGEAKTGLVKASEPEPARKAASKKAAPGQAASGATGKPAAKPAAKAPARKAAGKAPAKTLTPREAAAKKVANRTAAGKRVATRSPARKALAAVQTVVAQPRAKAPAKTAAKSAAKPVARTAARSPAKPATKPASKASTPARAPARKKPAPR
jgi:ribosome-associated protein